jgi:Flp pilus assembly protein TadG
MMMSPSIWSRSVKSPRAFMKRFKRFATDVRGVAAVEFACIAPIILLMLIGTLEASRALAVDRRYNLATSMVADLVGRETKLTANDVNAIYNIVAQVMSPFDASTLKISLIPVKASSTDASNTKVYAATGNRPSYHGGVQPSKCASFPLTTGLVAKGASVIVIKTSYDYTPALVGYLWGSSTWTEQAIVSPRNSCVDFDTNNCVSTCF